ncbi:hypothetical protein FC56_GL001244 [Lentilactobacillus senioris DSM 24302 = JCM 17472]|uniref:Reverse transcriptase domain-containing protein n=1 Tax=Lentilactobacillus senioris DSM 24302 = JCM 17472 TaxID=1423802 RepID=A0A0R2CWZ6_9LACO|nr:RNA-directed DNA polymerase [Lentilactobacillus senioris]KRM94292.1 hypothetical protein FC56_GL001244 [Lentilactobacillus senioris DSM 24302 = JCM 17472]
MANNYFLRTDILPEEVPLLFSNKQLFSNKNFTETEIRKIILNQKENIFNFPKLGEFSKKQESIPFKYQVNVRKNKSRTLSLLHPLAQLQCLIFIIKFENKITIAASRSNFSVRYPITRNNNQLDLTSSEITSIKKLEGTFLQHTNKHISSEQLIRSFRHYFSYSKVQSMNELYNSSDFINAQEKFMHMVKIDIQNFFPSIYTHTLSWVLFRSKKNAKLYRSSDMFENTIDLVAREINYGETNGIIIGPEFSRILAEILLCQIDNNVESKLYKEKIIHERDYKIFRFVDDIFIFYDEEKIKNYVINILKKQLSDINLTLNSSKMSVYSFTLSSSLSPVNKIGFYINNFKNKKIILSNVFSKNSLISADDIRGTNQDWKLLFTQVLQLSQENISDSSKIINYFLSSLQHFMNMKPGKRYIKYLNLLRTFLQGLTNLLKASPMQTTYTYTYYVLITLINQLEQSYKEDSYGKENLIKYFQMIFQCLSNLVSYSWFDINQGYDFLPILKYLNKFELYLNSYQLISMLKDAENKYFVWSSVAYYIYNTKDKNTELRYLTVKKVLHKLLSQYVINYSLKGKEKDIWFDSEWFYLLNDFSKYPGFNKAELNILKDKYLNSIKKTGLGKIAKEFSKNSYYAWDSEFEDFSKKLFYKKIISKYNKNINY